MSAAPAESAQVFLVSGGARGITAQCVRTLVRQCRGRFILVGRTDMAGPNPDWADEPDDAALKRRIADALRARGETATPPAIRRVFNGIRARQEIVATLAAAGGRAEYVAADVTDADGLRAALAEVIERTGPVTVVIHGAGVLADKRVEKKSAADYDAVYRTKLHGLRNLLSCVDTEQLSHLVLFSSAAGFYGNPGQSDYAIANETLDKFAQQFRRDHPHCRVLSIGWGPWSGGMVNPDLERLFTARGMDLIAPESGAALLADLLAAPQSPVHLLIGSPFTVPAPLGTELREQRVRRHLSISANPFLADHVIGRHAVLPVTCVMSWMAEACEQRYPGYRLFSAADYEVLNGIVFDDSLADAYQVDLTELKKDETAGEVTFAVVIASTTATGRQRYHYRSRLTLRRELPAAPRYDRIDLSDYGALDGPALYQDGTLFHGPRFRGVRRVVNLSPDRLTLQAELAPVALADQGQFRAGTLNPFVADVLFQGIVIWVRRMFNAAGLPLGAARGEQFRPLRFGTPYYVSIEPQLRSGSRVLADVVAHDADGTVHLRLSGAEVVISDRLNGLFAEGATLAGRV